MDRITDVSNGNARTFIDGNDLGGIDGTLVAALWLNGVQEEMVEWVEDVGLTPSSTDYTQIRRAAQITGRRAQLFASSGTFTVPAGVFRIRIALRGAGGAAGYNSSYAGGGGGSGGQSFKELAVEPGQSFSVTVGIGGTSSAVGNGAAGGTTSFGSVCSATGGMGGQGGTGATNAGGAGGQGYGGDYNDAGEYGHDGIQMPSGAPTGSIGGKGGGPGAGRGTTGFFTGVSAAGFGGGGGGGGGAAGGGSGASGGTGGGGYCLVEF